jgi:hypothetical protein
MADMTDKKRGSSDVLRDLSDAFDEADLSATEADIREDLSLLGVDAAKVAADMRAAVEEAKNSAKRIRLMRAKEGVSKFRSATRDAKPADRAALQARFQSIRSGANPQQVLMAARKGKQHSAADEDGILDDLAQLEALEAEDPKASDE